MGSMCRAKQILSSHCVDLQQTHTHTDINLTCCRGLPSLLTFIWRSSFFCLPRKSLPLWFCTSDPRLLYSKSSSFFCLFFPSSSLDLKPSVYWLTPAAPPVCPPSTSSYTCPNPFLTPWSHCVSWSFMSLNLTFPLFASTQFLLHFSIFLFFSN